MADDEKKTTQEDMAAPGCPRRARTALDRQRDERGKLKPFVPARRATRQESRIPLLIFLAIVGLMLIVHSMTVEDPYTRLQAISEWPVVDVSSKDLIDECGVFMWVRWTGPGFGPEEPYIPMSERYGR